jgi:hypothetical protein
LTDPVAETHRWRAILWVRGLESVVHGTRIKYGALSDAQMLAQRGEAMQLRYLQTLTQISNERSSTIVFPVPMGILSALANRRAGTRRARIPSVHSSPS